MDVEHTIEARWWQIAGERNQCRSLAAAEGGDFLRRCQLPLNHDGAHTAAAVVLAQTQMGEPVIAPDMAFQWQNPEGE